MLAKISYKHRFYVCVRSRDLETIWSNGFVLSETCKLDYETKKLEAWKQNKSVKILFILAFFIAFFNSSLSLKDWGKQ